MHPLKPLLLVGIGAAVATEGSDSVCSPVSTVFITVPSSPTTKTIYPLSKWSIASADFKVLDDGVVQATSTAVITTVTTSVVPTQVISLIQPSSPAERQAVYSFTEENGTTTWLGETPPSTSLVTSTEVVTLQPVPPGYVASHEEATPFTSYLTLFSTETIAETRTKTQTLANITASASAGAYGGLASNGWNSSMSTFITVKYPSVVSATITKKPAQYSGTAYPLIPSGVVAHSSENAARQIKPRVVGDVVAATIDGAIVSWTNSYDGTSPSTSVTSSTVVPVLASAPQSETESTLASGSFSSPVRTESSSSAGPSTTVGVYAWGVPPTPSLTSTSSSSAVQPATSAAISSSLYSNTPTALSTAATATASSCGDATADFVINFDNLPAFSAGPGVCALSN